MPYYGAPTLTSLLGSTSSFFNPEVSGNTVKTHWQHCKNILTLTFLNVLIETESFIFKKYHFNQQICLIVVELNKGNGFFDDRKQCFNLQVSFSVFITIFQTACNSCAVMSLSPSVMVHSSAFCTIYLCSLSLSLTHTHTHTNTHTHSLSHSFLCFAVLRSLSPNSFIYIFRREEEATNKLKNFSNFLC